MALACHKEQEQNVKDSQNHATGCEQRRKQYRLRRSTRMRTRNMLTRLMKTTPVGVWKMPSEPRPRQILPMTQTVQKTTEILQLQFPDHLIDVPLAFVVLVPQMQVVSETVEISQLDVVEKSTETPEIQTIHGTQTSDSLSTAPVRQMAQSEVVEAIEIRVKTIYLECVKVHPAGLVKPDDPDTQIKFLAAETLHGIHGNRFAKELRRKDCVMGKMWKNKPSDEIAWHCKHCTERGVMKLHESGTALAEGMGVPVSKMEELIAAHCQTFLKTVKDPDRDPYPAYPSSKSWYKAEARQRSSEPVTVIQYSAARSFNSR